MRIRVDFSLEIKPVDLPALRELAGGGDTTDAMLFVKAEAQEHVVLYLSSNGVPLTITRDATLT